MLLHFMPACWQIHLHVFVKPNSCNNLKRNVAAETGLTLSSVIHEEVGVRPQLEVEEQEIPCVGGVEMHVAVWGWGRKRAPQDFA